LRKTYVTTARGILDQHLLPRFGALAIGALTRAQILREAADRYQTRHTAATPWLAAGEAPEWIARQLGHA
jgi:integrase